MKTEAVEKFKRASGRFLQRRIEFCAPLLILRASLHMTTSQSAAAPPAWDIQAARALYNIQRWGARYFDINEAGHVVAMPLREAGTVVDITDVIEEAKGRGLQFPVLIRFQDILRHRVEAINQAFAASIAEFNYQNIYRGVFPIKVNQLREVVEEILDAGKPYQLWAGSGEQAGIVRRAGAAKPGGQPDYLQRVQGHPVHPHGADGHQAGQERDPGGGEAGGTQADHRRLPPDGRRAAAGHPRPPLQQGRRQMGRQRRRQRQIRLEHRRASHGHRTVARRKNGALLQAPPFPHRLAGARTFSPSRRPCRKPPAFTPNFSKWASPFESLDVGGGLGVDYDGSRSASDSSTNYTLREYTNDMVFYIAEVCNQEKVPHPQIVSESGRAIVAHHSVLIVEIFGAIEKTRAGSRVPDAESKHALVRDLLDIRKNLPELHKLEAYHDALDRREESQHMFALGLLDLPDKAIIESLYWEISREVVQSFQGRQHVPEEIRKLEESLGDQFLCNFSVFQSLLDHWALGQLFPIMPVSRLNEAPNREGTLVDITCDSDGQVNKFIDIADVRDTLRLHALRSNGNGPEPYYLGFFLMGAYQDIMGDLHNLFGRVNEVHVFLDPDEPSGYYVEEIIEGSTIVQTLTSVQYDEHELKRQMKMQVDEAIKSDRLKPSEAMRLLDDFERGLKDYTYLTS